MSESRNGSDLYALLIAVDFCLPNRLPDKSWYPSLKSCVWDVQHVDAMLTSRFQVPLGNIIKLTATDAGEAQSPEPPEVWPTYANMVAAFQNLTADTSNFRWLELPPLDKPQTWDLAEKSKVPASPLESMFAAFTDEKPMARVLTPAAALSQGWITAQVEVRITAS